MTRVGVTGRIHARVRWNRATEDVSDSHTKVLVDQWWIEGAATHHGDAWSISGERRPG